ncbi:hypothetical protein GO730_20750 [Spirosoma sp. HMF3257]|uniref:Uncharacterized protein n=1 Tax=Spirosoma telluris TaxID=2183553 RepID=A0A327NTB3_9BACT|nr:hypothetical protein [Spirosoma telluris]RAI75978.1 hypothetical protein HMF3257_20670 [Spirosoma telluris]
MGQINRANTVAVTIPPMTAMSYNNHGVTMKLAINRNAMAVITENMPWNRTVYLPPINNGMFLYLQSYINQLTHSAFEKDLLSCTWCMEIKNAGLITVPAFPHSFLNLNALERQINDAFPQPMLHLITIVI